MLNSLTIASVLLLSKILYLANLLDLGSFKNDVKLLFLYFKLEDIFQKSSGVKLSISSSLSITNCSTGDCTLPAEVLPFTFFHNTGPVSYTHLTLPTKA